MGSVEDIGGLSAGTIEARILRSKLETREMLDQIMQTHKDEINARFDKRDTAVNDRFDTIEDALKGAALHQAEISKQIALVSQSVANFVDRGSEWHESDIAYKRQLANDLEKSNGMLLMNAKAIEELRPEVANIRKHQIETKETLQRMNWLFGAVKMIRLVPQAVKDGKEWWTMSASIFSGCVFLWITLHSIIPKIHYYVFEHHPFSWWGF